MLTVAEATEIVFQNCPALPAENVSLADALGRALAQDIFASTDSPSFDNSAVDGFAVHADDTQGVPVTLPQHDYLPAGALSTQELPRGYAARIMTGAPIPPAADAIVMVEDTTSDGARVLIRRAAQRGDHIRRRSEDMRAGTLLLRRGTAINAGHINVLASQGAATPSVSALPRIAILTTGDELISCEQSPAFGQVRNSNLPLMQALSTQTPARVVAQHHCADSLDATRDSLRELASQSDVILTCGGVSAGDRDFIRPALESLGELVFAGVKMKPGKPFAFGKIGDALLFALPGNPLSAFVTYEVLVRPALRKMSGFAGPHRTTVSVIAAHDFSAPKGRDEYVRVRIFQQGTSLHAASSGFQGSHAHSSLIEANALLLLPASTQTLQGETRTAIYLGES